MKKDINSNGYIFLYTTILVIVVSVLLSATAIWLAPYQKENKENEKRMNILNAAGITGVNKDNTYACEAECPKLIKRQNISRLNRHWIGALLGRDRK